MGWASLLAGSVKNPFTSWLGQNANMLRGTGVGIASGNDLNTGFANAARYAADGAQKDDAYAVTQKAEADRQEQLNKTMDFLRNSAPQYAAAVEAGVLSPADAYGMHLKGQEAPAPTKMEFRDVNGDIIGLDPYTGQSQTVYDGQPTPAAPSPGYRWSADGQSQEFIPGGSADPVNRGKDLTQAEQRNRQLASVVEPELQTVEANWDALTDPGNQMIGANTPLGAPGYAATSPGYQQATNSLKTIAQSYLYSVSGAAATDAETQKIVDSVTPKFGESKESADNKKKLIRRMVESVKQAGGGKVDSAPASEPANVDDILTKYGV